RHRHGRESTITVLEPPPSLLAARASMTTPAENAERAALFLLQRVRAARGRLWDEGACPAPGHPSPALAPPPPPAGAPALSIFATRRVRGVSPVVARALLAWARGQRPAELVFHVVP